LEDAIKKDAQHIKAIKLVFHILLFNGAIEEAHKLVLKPGTININD